MRITIKYTLALLLTIAAVSASPDFSKAQAANSGDKQPRAEVAVGYSYLHSNAPPGGCGCFNMNGGNATFAWPVKQGGFAVVGDVTVEYASGIGSGDLNLKLASFTAGTRYLPRIGHNSQNLTKLQPFGQVLVGLAHASGTLAGTGTPAAVNAGAAFAAIMGGGVDLRLSRSISLRLAEADYMLTTAHNDTNNHQNNFRIGAGVVFHF